MIITKNQNSAVSALSSEEVKTGLFGKIFGKSHDDHAPQIWVADIQKDSQEDLNEIQEYHNPMLGIDKAYFDKD